MKHFLFTALFLALAGILHAQHSVVLKTGEKVKGVVIALNDDVLTIYVNREPKEIHLRDVSSIFFDEYVPYDGTLNDDTPVKRIKSLDGAYVVEYQIKDRDMTLAPRLSNATQKKGTVVVEVLVNRAGTVIKAKSGVTGSTTSDEYLLTKAEYACKGVQFSEHMTGPLETSGLITIHY
ncbi:MAG: hypothetical protein HQ500_00660 [Flavobacteriales bacterium]|nr:hypothetical protein [Flavobacteriales bacterium]